MTSQSEKTIRSEQAAIKQEKRSFNNRLCNFFIIGLIVLGAVYLWDVNTLVVKALTAVAIALMEVWCYLFNSVSPDETTIAVVSIVLKYTLGITFVIFSIGAWYTNKQNK